MPDLFVAAANDPALADEIDAAVRNVASAQDPAQLLQSASRNPSLKAAIQGELARIATAPGLGFQPEPSSAEGEATARLDAIQKMMSRAPTPPASPPVALLFIALGLLFAPSAFKSAPQELFSDPGDPGKLDGITR